MNDRVEREREAMEDGKSGRNNSKNNRRLSNSGMVNVSDTPSGGKRTQIDMRKGSTEDLKRVASSFSHLPVDIKD